MKLLQEEGRNPFSSSQKGNCFPNKRLTVSFLKSLENTCHTNYDKRIYKLFVCNELQYI